MTTTYLVQIEPSERLRDNYRAVGPLFAGVESIQGTSFGQRILESVLEEAEPITGTYGVTLALASISAQEEYANARQRIRLAQRSELELAFTGPAPEAPEREFLPEPLGAGYLEFAMEVISDPWIPWEESPRRLRSLGQLFLTTAGANAALPNVHFGHGGSPETVIVGWGVSSAIVIATNWDIVTSIFRPGQK